MPITRPREVTERKDFRKGWMPSKGYRSSENCVVDMTNCWFEPGKAEKAGLLDSNFAEDGAITELPNLSVVGTSTREAVFLYRSEDESGNVLRLVYHDNGVGAQLATLNADGSFNTNIKSGLTSGTTPGMCTVTDPDGIVYVFVCNGLDTPFKVRVSNAAVSDIGLTGRPAVGQLSIARSGSGNVTGIVWYHIAEVSSGVEGTLSAGAKYNSGPAPDEVTITFDHADLYNKEFRVYRTYADGADPFYVGSVEVGATSTDFVDNTHDDDLGNPPFTHGDSPPSEIKDWVSYYDRVYGITNGELYWSDLGQPESWYTASDGNFLRFGFGDGDVGTAITRFGDSLLLWSEDHLYQVFGRIPSEFTLKEVIPSDGPTKSIGCADRRAITYAPDGQYFYWQKRIYKITASSVVPVSTPIDRLLPPDTAQYEFGKAALIYSPIFGRVFCSVASVNSSDAEFGKTFFWDVEEKKWVGEQSVGYRTYMNDTDSSGEEVLRGAGEWTVDPADADRHDIVEYSNWTWAGASSTVKTSGFGAQTPALKRYLYFDVVMANYNTNDFDSITVTVTVDENQIVSETINKESISTYGRTYRIAAPAIGNHANVSVTMTATGETASPAKLYEVSATYQILGNQYRVT